MLDDWQMRKKGKGKGKAGKGKDSKESKESKGKCSKMCFLRNSSSMDKLDIQKQLLVFFKNQRNPRKVKSLKVLVAQVLLNPVKKLSSVV